MVAPHSAATCGGQRACVVYAACCHHYFHSGRGVRHAASGLSEQKGQWEEQLIALPPYRSIPSRVACEPADVRVRRIGQVGRNKHCKYVYLLQPSVTYSDMDICL